MRKPSRSRLPTLAFLLTFLSALAAAPSFADDFADGLAAYDAGDFVTAFEAWLPLAEAGDAEAQLSLAGLYESGLGVSQDPAEAVRWYRAAAEQGDPVGQLNLGDLYAKGEGVARDLGLAVYWLTLSACQGRKWPKRRIAELGPLIMKRERAEAQRLLADHCALD